MKTVHHQRTTCRLCSSCELEVVLVLKPTPPADAYVPASRVADPQPSYPLDLCLCRECGFVQLSEVVYPETIYLDYLYETVSSLGLVEHFRQYASAVVGKLHPKAEVLAVDIGSNDGTLLRAFQQHGMKVLGVDPAREIARQATADGVPTLPEFFTGALGRQIRREHGPASVITANNVMANIDDLDDLIEAIRGLLASDGVFVLETPHLGELMNNMVFDFIYHEHMSYFTVAPLARFFGRHGLELFDLEPVPTKGGSLRYFVQLAGGPRKLMPVVGEWLEREQRTGVARAETYRAFNGRIEAAKQTTLGLLGELKRQGKAFAGYGASATTTTLIYHFELEKYLDYLVDEYARKQNTFSPGLHLPVLAPEALAKRGTSHVVILAWRYVEPILKKNAAFQAAGGRFIVPLPELRVL